MSDGKPYCGPDIEPLIELCRQNPGQSPMEQFSMLMNASFGQDGSNPFRDLSRNMTQMLGDPQAGERIRRGENPFYNPEMGIRSRDQVSENLRRAAARGRGEHVDEDENQQHNTQNQRQNGQNQRSTQTQRSNRQDQRQHNGNGYRTRTSQGSDSDDESEDNDGLRNMPDFSQMFGGGGMPDFSQMFGGMNNESDNGMPDFSSLGINHPLLGFNNPSFMEHMKNRIKNQMTPTIEDEEPPDDDALRKVFQFSILQNWKKAKEHLQKVIDRQKNTRAYSLYGTIELNLGNYQEALGWLTKGREFGFKEPDYDNLRFILSDLLYIYNDQSDIKKAQKCCKELQDLQVQDIQCIKPKARLHLDEIQFNLGLYNKAASNFEKHLLRYDNNPSAFPMDVHETFKNAYYHIQAIMGLGNMYRAAYLCVHQIENFNKSLNDLRDERFRSILKQSEEYNQMIYVAYICKVLADNMQCKITDVQPSELLSREFKTARILGIEWDMSRTAFKQSTKDQIVQGLVYGKNQVASQKTKKGNLMTIKPDLIEAVPNVDTVHTKCIELGTLVKMNTLGYVDNNRKILSMGCTAIQISAQLLKLRSEIFQKIADSDIGISVNDLASNFSDVMTKFQNIYLSWRFIAEPFQNLYKIQDLDLGQMLATLDEKFQPLDYKNHVARTSEHPLKLFQMPHKLIYYKQRKVVKVYPQFPILRDTILSNEVNIYKVIEPSKNNVKQIKPLKKKNDRLLYQKTELTENQKEELRNCKVPARIWRAFKNDILVQIPIYGSEAITDSNYKQATQNETVNGESSSQGQKSDSQQKIIDGFEGMNLNDNDLKNSFSRQIQINNLSAEVSAMGVRDDIEMFCMNLEIPYNNERQQYLAKIIEQILSMILKQILEFRTKREIIDSAMLMIYYVLIQGPFYKGNQSFAVNLLLGFQLFLGLQVPQKIPGNILLEFEAITNTPKKFIDQNKLWIYDPEILSAEEKQKQQEKYPKLIFQKCLQKQEIIQMNDTLRALDTYEKRFAFFNMCQE